MLRYSVCDEAILNYKKAIEKLEELKKEYCPLIFKR